MFILGWNVVATWICFLPYFFMSLGSWSCTKKIPELHRTEAELLLVLTVATKLRGYGSHSLTQNATILPDRNITKLKWFFLNMFKSFLKSIFVNADHLYTFLSSFRCFKMFFLWFYLEGKRSRYRPWICICICKEHIKDIPLTKNTLELTSNLCVCIVQLICFNWSLIK